MTDIAKLGFEVDTKGLTKGEKSLKKYAKTGDKVEKSTEKNAKSISSSYKMIAGAIGTVATALLSLNKLVDVSRQFGVLNAQLITATGSAENAAVAFEAIQKFAATTPFDLGQATKAFTQLVNLGLTPSEAAMTSYGNTASAMGKDLSQMIEAVADAATGEFERLKEFGIKSRSEGENVSFTFRGVTKTIKKEAASIEGYLMALGENEFAGAMAERAKTLDGAISNLGDTWNSLFLTVSQQGVGDIIKDGVIIAANAIQQLSDWIASGALTESFIAVAGKFDGFVKDISNGVNIISAIIGESAKGWSKSTGTFFDNMLQGFKQLPEMVRFFIQLTVVSLAEMVDHAKIQGDAFVQVLSLRFDRLVAKASLDGRKIANAMNPFSDTLDYTSELDELMSRFATAENQIIQNAKARSEAITTVSNDLISAYALEGQASIDNYKERIKLSDQLLANYKKEKEAQEGDVLSQFKVIPEETIDVIEEIEEKVESLQKTLSGSDMFGMIGDSAKEALSAVQGLSAQGSKEYAKLGIAIQSVTAAQKVMNAVTQLSLATVTGGISAIVGLIGMIGSFGGGIESTFEANQAGQGLNVWGEKADSIAKSIDITASATDKLVGINTGMLKALQSLEAGISGAAGISSRGAAGADFSFTPNIKENAFGNFTDTLVGKILNIANLGLFKPIVDFIGNLLGGSSSVTDEGIQIMGGTFADIIDGAAVFAFKEMKSKKYVWSSTKTNTELFGLDEAGRQFSLVFGSLADTVFEGGKALGLSTTELERSINKFEIATTKISLKDLSIEEQQAEIEAVFSQIFDDLAVSVIPFISEFQQTGEGLGETLARVATQVQIAEFAAKNLGFTLTDKLANPQLFAQIADNLTMMVGGIEAFASKTASFLDTFAPEAVKFEIASNAINEALKDVGLTLPDTTEAFFELMEGATPEQVAALLNAQDSANDYYDLLEDRNDKAAKDLAEQLATEEKAARELQAFNNSLLSLSSNLRSAIAGIYGTEVEASSLSLTSALEAARGGDFSEALGLNLSNLSPAMEGFKSLEAFNIEQAITANKIAELADLTAQTATAEDMMLTANQEQVALLTNINSNIASAYVPEQTQTKNNDSMIVELKAIRQELNGMKSTNEENKVSNKKSADSLQRIEIGGVRTIA